MHALPSERYNNLGNRFSLKGAVLGRRLLTSFRSWQFIRARPKLPMGAKGSVRRLRGPLRRALLELAGGRRFRGSEQESSINFKAQWKGFRMTSIAIAAFARLSRLDEPLGILRSKAKQDPITNSSHFARSARGSGFFRRAHLALQGSMRAIIARTARICLPSRVK